ncbi:MAG: PIN domain-containing protein [Egibacteraceae bacterium]
MTPKEVPDGPLCVDTDVFSWVYGSRERYLEFDALMQGHLLVISFAAVGELHAGAIKARWGDRRREQLERALHENYLVLTATDGVVRKYAELHARFKGRLKNGGGNDMWTAACVLAQPEPVPLVTNNLSDFQTIGSEFPLHIVHPDV